MTQNKNWKRERITKNQRDQLLSVVDGRISLIESELKRLGNLLVKDLESFKKFIETL